MSFRTIENKIKPTYKSSHDDLIDDFYNVVLSESVKYDRITGFFNSTSLAIASQGLSKFINNNGHMRLLCGAQLNEDDLESIKNANDLRNFIDRKFLNDLDTLEDEINKNHVKVLGWMIANNFLDIKIGIKCDDEGYAGGMLHSKIGILYDDKNDIITFDGSTNETASGWKYNLESLKVFLSWKDLKFMYDDINDFEKDWNNKNPKLEVFDIPEASKKQLINIAPKNKDELNKLKLSSERQKKQEKKLFKHQEEAIKAWFNNNNKGILEMATGTGKTFTALKCLEQVLAKENILTIIACPQIHLVEQWSQDIENMGLGKVHRFYGSVNANWRREMDDLLFRISLGVSYAKPNIILTTHYSFATDDFVNKINDYDKKLFLIVDEVHHVGSCNFRKGLLEKYDYRLGLSATPSRFFDEEGTVIIDSFFNGSVYTFNITNALTIINPQTNKTFLTPYDYFPVKVDLSHKELKEYKDLTKKISKLYHITEEDNKETIENLIFKRKNIIKNAIGKYKCFRNILKNMTEKDHLIVFCSSNQMNKILIILEEESFTPKHTFTQHESVRREEDYNDLSERQFILKKFDEGKYKALIAIKCLDEGIDVPSANKVIIMSSTSNPAEYIQRRGRVLRRYPGKDKAYIYDLSVIPEGDEFFIQNIINNESDRLFDFINNANNKSYGFKLLREWRII